MEKGTRQTLLILASAPFWIQLILYGRGCLSVFNSNAFIRAFDTMFSQLPLSIITLHALLLVVQRVLKIECRWLLSSSLGASNAHWMTQLIGSPSSPSTSSSATSSSLLSPFLGFSSPSSITWTDRHVGHSLDRCPSWLHQKHFPTMGLVYGLLLPPSLCIGAFVF